eukprot:scaffold42284_cov40-Phaeocystis_antarctica.AAC.1
MPPFVSTMPESASSFSRCSSIHDWRIPGQGPAGIKVLQQVNGLLDAPQRRRGVALGQGEADQLSAH